MSKVMYWMFFFSVIGLTLLIDQLTKTWIVHNLMLYESRVPIPALGDFFRITRTFNTGAAFGIFSESGDIFLAIAVVVVMVMLYVYPRIPHGQWLLRFGMGLVAAGALGNAIDRLIYGHVVDFINYRIPNVFSNVSNLADHAITGGVILMIVDNLLQERRARRQKYATDASADSPADVDPTS